MRNLIAIFLLFWGLFCPLRGDEDSIIVTDNGLEMFAWDLDFVRQAKQSIEVSAVFMGGEIARELFKALRERLERVPGLQVYILTTPILLEKPDWKMIEQLQADFPHRFHLEHATTQALVWPDVAGIDNHAKMFIVDEKYYSMGGTNLDETSCSDGTWTPPRNNNKVSIVANNLPAGMRDQDIVGKGPMAKQLRHTFYKFYALWEHYNKTGIFEKDPEKFASKNHYFEVTEEPFVSRFDTAEKQRIVNSSDLSIMICGPYQKQNAITKEYTRLIKEAKEEIIIANLYFCPVDSILKALIDAVNRGVKLTLITNGVSEVAPDYTKYFCWANRVHYVPVFYGSTYHFWDAWSMASKPVKKTRIFEYHVKDILLHKKMMLIDGKTAVIGSYNLGYRSDMGDYELIMRIESEAIVEDLKQVHKKDLQFCREISVEEARDWYFDPVTSALGEMQKRFHGLL